MQINIEQILLEDQYYVKITKNKNFPNDTWRDLIRYLSSYDNESIKEENNDYLITEWISLLSILKELKDLKEYKNFSITYSEDAKIKIKETIKNTNLINSNNFQYTVTENDIKNLKKFGFNKFELNKYQIRDLKRLFKLSHGANFSVQGSGKTAVTIATHLILKNLKKNPINSLIVVAPKNAFLGWEDGFNDCLDENSILKKEGLIELTGSHELVKKKLQSGNKNFIINYEKLLNTSYLIANFVQKNRVHFVLDESHKIKSEGAQRSQAVLSLSHRLNFYRKDILTGTPAPNSLDDINSQYQFLYPGPEYNGDRFWVRTTKKELNLPKTIIQPINIEMSKPQLSLYTRVLNPFIASIKSNANFNYKKFRDIRKSIIRLIQLSSNPILVTRKQEEEGNIIFGDNIDSDIHQALVEEENTGGCTKIRAAANLARELASKGKKTVIWSYFRHNIEFLGHYLLKDLNAEYIHGGVDMGNDDEELNTRKYKIKKFKDPNSNCMTLVANYASCAEGISLHHVCHDAIYIDRSFQADQYLQSIDRICRLGNYNTKNIYILQSKTPSSVKNIDLTVATALQSKIDNMGRFLNDPDLTQVSIEESRGELPIDDKISNSELEQIVNYFRS
jgi:SNF2 family DNA or RNA helicase